MTAFPGFPEHFLWWSGKCRCLPCRLVVSFWFFSSAFHFHKRSGKLENTHISGAFIIIRRKSAMRFCRRWRRRLRSLDFVFPFSCSYQNQFLVLPAPRPSIFYWFLRVGIIWRKPRHRIEFAVYVELIMLNFEESYIFSSPQWIWIKCRWVLGYRLNFERECTVRGRDFLFVIS